MNNDLKKQIDNKNSSFGFIKTTDAPLQELSDQQKVALNRKANALFNEGKTDLAERIFITTGYSDGLTRVGGVYEKRSEFIKALRLYLLAHNKRKSEPIIKQIAGTVSAMLKM